MTARENLAREIERLNTNASFGTVEVNKAIGALVAEARAEGRADRPDRIARAEARGAAAVRARVEAEVSAMERQLRDEGLLEEDREEFWANRIRSAALNGDTDV